MTREMNIMSNDSPNMEQILAESETVGVIGSPSTTTEIKMDIRGAAAENKLVGEMAVLKHRQQGNVQYALGQITEVQLRNRMLEDHAILTIARQRGSVDHVSDRQDTHDGTLRVSAVYKESPDGYQTSSMGTVPPTGTDIKIASNALIDEIIRDHQDNVFYLGTSYQSELDLPMWFRQFNGTPGQLAEAHHIGIFGRSGSGKSTLAKLILLAYATHPEMGILIIDPQGEFAKSLTGRPEQFRLDMATRIRELGRPIINIDVSNIVLDRWDLVQELLAQSRFISTLGMENRSETTAEIIRGRFEGQVNLTDLHTHQSFEIAWDSIREALQQRRIYSTDTPIRRVSANMDRVDQGEIYQREWQPVMNLFNQGRPGAQRADRVINQVLSSGGSGIRPIVNINLDARDQENTGIQWNDRIRNIIIYHLLGQINRHAENAYRDDASLNTMVVIDEAHRLAPNRLLDSDDYAGRIRDRLIDAARTTRKYGLGWMFISQTLSSISIDIVRQTRIQFIGHGLGMGNELNALGDLVGGDRHDVKLYQSFKDPESAFSAESREYSFMAAGPVSPLCLTATPIFLNVYNNPETFFEKNSRAFPQHQGALEIPG